MPSSHLKKGITVWNRLEPRPRKVDFDRTLRAEVRDALWMLSRQWQFGELKGEDTGTALYARAEMETTLITKMARPDNSVVSIDSSRVLEADVEREIIDYDTALRIEMGQHFTRILRKKLSFAGASSLDITTIIDGFKNTTSPLDLSFSVPSDSLENAAILGNRNLLKVTAAVSQKRTIDGGKLRDYLLEDPTHAASDFFLSSDYSDVINAAGNDFMNWFTRVYSQPESENNSAWLPERLEYQFACSAPEPSGSATILAAEEYYQGSLDWYSFDFVSPQGYPEALVNNTAPPQAVTKSKFTAIPSEVRFAGMPNARWWEMEDRKINLGEIDANTTDTAKVLLAEFGLIYSNDWTIIPWTVPVGSLSELKQLVVTDVFGQRTLVKSAGESLSNPFAWNMYGLHTKVETDQPDNRLFIPPVINKSLESQPIEAVNFIRDEMANMVWGIETIIPDGLGKGIDGFEAATQFHNYLLSLAEPTPLAPGVENDAEIRYQIANTVPENWIPFVPVKSTNSLIDRQTKLQRAAMPRIINGLPVSRVRPRTNLLQEGANNIGTPSEMWNPYYIHEEEIPRSGTLVTRTWQRTRMEDGTIVTWLGRRKSNGRGEGNSGLAFDTIEPK